MDKTERIIHFDSVDDHNKLYGWETLHPLVTVGHHDHLEERHNHLQIHYGLYALFLKQGDGCSLRYGREKYDYQEGTIVSMKPGQVTTVEWSVERPMPPSRGLLFHPDLIYGTSLGRHIHEYTFFDYDQRESLHLSERERRLVGDLLDQIQAELEHPVDKHSKRLITDSIALLLDYCTRFYDRQFITREKVNSDIMADFDRALTAYFVSGEAAKQGLPAVSYFAEKAHLSPGYFGDLVKKTTGNSAQHYIQRKIIELSKQLVLDSKLNISQVAGRLGFQYPQHFTRLFKQHTGMTPKEYRQ